MMLQMLADLLNEEAAAAQEKKKKEKRIVNFRNNWRFQNKLVFAGKIKKDKNKIKK